MSKATSLSARERAIGWTLHGIAERLGYVEAVSIPELFGRPSACWCFTRSDAPLPLAALCFGIFWRPQRTLDVAFLGSTMSAEDLKRLGIERNAISFNMSQFQVYQLGRDPSCLLPPSIELGEPSAWPAVFVRVEEELRSIHPEVWERIAREWESRS